MKLKKEVQEVTGTKGVYHITKAFLETPEQFALDAKILSLRKKLESYRAKTGLVAYFLKSKIEALEKEVISNIRFLNSISRTERLQYVNLVPTVARTMIANNLTNASPTYVMKITHAALGSSATAPNNTDTQLGTETYRNAIASITNSSNIAYATAFFSAPECSGTYAEAGIFSNGTGSANTGVLDSHVAVSITKTTSQTLTIDYTLTIS